MPNRSVFTGFESGGRLDSVTALPAGMTIESSAARSGDFGLKVVAPSGSASSISFSGGTSGGGASSAFHRIYVRPISLPSIARRIFGFSSSGTSNHGIYLNSDGTLTLRQHNGTEDVGTSDPLDLNTWYRVEVAHDVNNDRMAFKLNGEWVSAGWVSVTAQSFELGSVAIGALDTAAAAFEIHFDDYAKDVADWCGYSKTAYIPVQALISDHADWTLTGAASKLAALNDSPAAPDDDSGYILSPTNTTSEIIFGFTGQSVIPSGAIPISVQAIARTKRNAAADATSSVRGLVGDYNGTGSHTWGDAARSVYGNKSAQVVEISTWQRLSRSSKASQWHYDDIANIRLGLTGHATNQSRFTMLGIEVEYDDRDGAVYDNIGTGVVMSFEAPLAAENQVAGASNAASASIVTTQFVTGAQALRLNPSAVAARVDIPDQTYTFNVCYSASLRARVAVRPASTTDLCGVSWNNGDTVGFMVSMDSTGAIGARTSTQTKGMSAANVIPLDQWVDIKIFVHRSLTTSSGDGVLKVWVDGVLVINETDLSTASISSAAALVLGGYVSSTVDIYFEDAVMQNGYALLADDDVRCAFLRPSAVAVAGSGFTAVGNADRALAMAEVTPDDDTSYLVVPSSTTDIERYDLTDLPVDAARVYAVAGHMRRARDGATNGSLGFHFQSGDSVIDIDSDFSSSSAYGYGSMAAGNARVTTSRVGAWTVDMVNDLEMRIKAGSVNASRLTWAGFPVAYSTNPLPDDPDMAVTPSGPGPRATVIIC